MSDEDKFADEVMSDEELDNVAGGEAHEMRDDRLFEQFERLVRPLR